jgi:hypothetical protein
VLSLDCLSRHPALAQKMHMSPIYNVDKVGSIAGRTVFDASVGKNSLNDGADRERCDYYFIIYAWLPYSRQSDRRPAQVLTPPVMREQGILLILILILIKLTLKLISRRLG